MLPGETIAAGAPSTCPDCGTKLVTQVLRSPAGYYIGTWCECGPYSRESGYFPDNESAEHALKFIPIFVWERSSRERAPRLTDP
jgi:hypothetical protein